ncbi:MAG: ABC transporter permease [Pseudomonadota bacterium]|nr:ABC transporter permease [Pseudomonadota bacterium]
MLAYYLKLARVSLRRNRALTVLMVLTIAVGIGATMTTLTVFRTLSGNPIPDKSERLFRVQLDMYPQDSQDIEPPNDVSRFDAEALLAEGRAKRQVITASSGTVIAGGEGGEPMLTSTRSASADFFPMFNVPLRYGQPWQASEDAAAARVAVITDELNEKLFAGGNSVGKELRINDTAFRIVGVMAPWRPTPRFYDNNVSAFSKPELAIVPYHTARALGWGAGGNMNCFAMYEGAHTDLNAPCAWLQYWVELESADKAGDFRRYLQNYSAKQKDTGRFSRPPNVRLRDVMAWLDYTRVVPADIKLQLWLALGFLAVCLVNVVGLMLAKFLRRSGEIGVRRALGASRWQIFLQLLVEGGLIGLIGGVAGLLLAFLGLWGVRQQPSAYAELAQMNLPMLLTTFVIAVAASLLAALLPAWRAMHIPPAIQLKLQ